MKRKQFIATWVYMMLNKRTSKIESVTLYYTVIMIDGKMVRAFNHSHTKKGFMSFNSISPKSEIFLYLKNKYENYDEGQIDSVILEQSQLLKK